MRVEPGIELSVPHYAQHCRYVGRPEQGELQVETHGLITHHFGFSAANPCGRRRRRDSRESASTGDGSEIRCVRRASCRILSRHPFFVLKDLHDLHSLALAFVLDQRP